MRPENPYKRDNYLGRPDTMRHIAFEAGADAMYEPAYQKGRKDEREALKKEGIRASNIRDIRYPKSDVLTIPTLERMKEMQEIEGVWVFIEEEK